MTERQTTPPYSEAQAMAWLAWLAYSMQRRDQTIFQIENLQPDWLTGRRETAPFLLLTRILWGAVSGLIVGLIVGLIERLQSVGLLSVEMDVGLIDGLIVGLSVGLSVGLIVGLIELAMPLNRLDIRLRAESNPTEILRTGALKDGLIFGLIVGLIFGLIVGPPVGLSDGLIEGLIAGLSVGLIFGLIFGVGSGLSFGYIRTSRVLLRDAGRRIRPVESLQWSRHSLRHNAQRGLYFGLIFGSVFAFIVVLINWLFFSSIFLVRYDWLDSLIDAVRFGLIVALSFGLIGGLVGGFQPGAQELKTRPNQGIRLTVRSAVKIGLPVGIVAALAGWLLFEEIFAGIFLGAIVSLLVGLWYGGLDAIEHGLIRLIVARRGHAPLNYARFLDYAADELNFLQKVGGGYVFIHRYLLEHFAEIAVEQGYVSPAEEEKPKRV